MKYKRYLFTNKTPNPSTISMQKSRLKKRLLNEAMAAGSESEESSPNDSTSASLNVDPEGAFGITTDSAVIEDQHVQHATESTDSFSSAQPASYSSEPQGDSMPIMKEIPNNISAASSFHRKDHDINIQLPPLCSHTESTPDDVLLMALSIVCRHKLTWAVMVDILKMVNAIFGVKKIKASKYSFLKRLLAGGHERELIYHYFCDDCSVYIEYEGIGNPTENLLCHICKKDVGKPNENYFASLSLESQLRQLLKDNFIADEILNHRFKRIKCNEDNFEDMYDGLEYKKLSAPGNILSHPQNFSYSIFIDGVAVGNRKKSLWPIYASINELPPKLRRKHILLIGLYYGKHDPDQQFFLKPFVKEANKLSSEGFTWDYKSTDMLSKVIPLIIVADSVARCKLLNIQTFSAYYGCTFCYQKPTRTVNRLKYTLPTEQVEQRTKESYKRDLQRAYEKRFEVQDKNRHYKGVKGPSSLADLPWFDLMSGCVVDYMHNILLGVCRTYFELVFDPSRRKFWTMLSKDEDERFTIQDVKSEIDSRLKTIKPPTSINRVPRSIQDCGAWKANEWRSWLLFYSVPCLKGLLKYKHLAHFVMLSEATSLLLQNSVSREDVNEAHRLFHLFTFHFQEYFGPQFMYYNIHLLAHICKGVLRWGPIFHHDAFMYESYNRTLLQMNKNPHRVVNEVCNKYFIMKNFPKMLDKLATHENSVFFCEDILDKKIVVCYRSSNCVLLGAGYHYDLPVENVPFLMSNGIDPMQCLFYRRLLFKGMRLTTTQYSADKNNDDSVVYLAGGEIYRILGICSGNCRVHLLLQEVELSDHTVFKTDHVTLGHVYEVINFGCMKILSPESIVGQCVFINTGIGMFLSKMPYGCYGD